MVAILNKFSVLCLSSYFVVYCSKLKLILFYNFCNLVKSYKHVIWEIITTEVENEMEIFKTLRKYNTYQQHEEGNRY